MKGSIQPIVIGLILAGLLLIPNPVTDTLLGTDVVHLSLFYSPEPVYASPISDFQCQASVMAVKGKAFTLFRSNTVTVREAGSTNTKMATFINWVMSALNLTITADIQVLNQQGVTVLDRTLVIRRYEDMWLDADIDRATLGDYCTINLTLQFHAEYTSESLNYTFDKTVTRTHQINLVTELDADGVVQQTPMEAGP